MIGLTVLYYTIDNDSVCLLKYDDALYAHHMLSCRLWQKACIVFSLSFSLWQPLLI